MSAVAAGLTLALVGSLTPWTVADASMLAQPSVPQIALEPAEVPGFAAVDRSVQTYQDPRDAGVDQAFRSCAGSDPLLSQYDEGGDSSISQVYGQGDNGFGAPALSVASVAFGSSNAGEIDGAYGRLASLSFQQCWLTGIDALNQAQGSVTPVAPSTVSSLSVPALGAAATGFLMHWNLSAGGPVLTGEFGVSVVKTGSYVLALVTLAWNGSFPDPTRTAILRNFVGRVQRSAGGIGPVTSTTTTTMPAPPAAPQPVPMPSVPCRPDAVPAGGARQGAQMARSSVDNQDLNTGSGLQAATYALHALYQHRGDAGYLVGFFNALDTKTVIGWLSFDDHGQPLAPADYDATNGSIVFAQNSDWYLKEFETAAATCQLTRATSYGFLNGINDLQPRLQALSRDPAAARGLMIHLSWQDILQAPEILEVPAYSEFAAAALAAGPEISVLAPPPWTPDAGAHFTLAQAVALEEKAQFTSEGEATLESALVRYAQATEPPAPPPQALGALAAGRAYTNWATEMGDLQWAISVVYAAQTAQGWEHPTVAGWYADMGRYDELPGANTDFSDLQKLEESNVAAAGDYLLLLQKLVVDWLLHQANASAIEQQDEAQAAYWLCGQEPTVEAVLFLSMLHSNRLLYTVDDSRTTPALLTDGVVINGNVARFDSGQFPPLPDTPGEYDDIASLLRPPSDQSYGSLLADSTGQSTGLSARVPFDAVLWSWEQRISQPGATACTDFPSIPALSPTSGIGSAIMVTGSGYAPNTAVTVTGHSRPVRLATAWTDGSGQFVAFVDPGAYLAPGAHQIIATGLDPKGAVRVLRWSVRIRAASTRRSSATGVRWWPLGLVLAAGSTLVVGLAAGARRRRHPRAAA